MSFLQLRSPFFKNVPPPVTGPPTQFYPYYPDFLPPKSRLELFDAIVLPTLGTFEDPSAITMDSRGYFPDKIEVLPSRQHALYPFLSYGSFGQTQNLHSDAGCELPDFNPIAKPYIVASQPSAYWNPKANNFNTSFPDAKSHHADAVPTPSPRNSSLFPNFFWGVFTPTPFAIAIFPDFILDRLRNIAALYPNFFYEPSSPVFVNNFPGALGEYPDLVPTGKPRNNSLLESFFWGVLTPVPSFSAIFPDYIYDRARNHALQQALFEYPTITFTTNFPGASSVHADVVPTAKPRNSSLIDFLFWQPLTPVTSVFAIFPDFIRSLARLTEYPSLTWDPNTNFTTIFPGAKSTHSDFVLDRLRNPAALYPFLSFEPSSPTFNTSFPDAQFRLPDSVADKPRTAASLYPNFFADPNVNFKTLFPDAKSVHDDLVPRALPRNSSWIPTNFWTVFLPVINAFITFPDFVRGLPRAAEYPPTFFTNPQTNNLHPDAKAIFDDMVPKGPPRNNAWMPSLAQTLLDFIVRGYATFPDAVRALPRLVEYPATFFGGLTQTNNLHSDAKVVAEDIVPRALPRNNSWIPSVFQTLLNFVINGYVTFPDFVRGLPRNNSFIESFFWASETQRTNVEPDAESVHADIVPTDKPRNVSLHPFHFWGVITPTPTFYVEYPPIIPDKPRNSSLMPHLFYDPTNGSQFKTRFPDATFQLPDRVPGLPFNRNTLPSVFFATHVSFKTLFPDAYFKLPDRVDAPRRNDATIPSFFWTTFRIVIPVLKKVLVWSVYPTGSTKVTWFTKSYKAWRFATQATVTRTVAKTYKAWANARTFIISLF